MATISLNMVVKNDANRLNQTLENILKLIPIDFWVICDNGSTDNTKELIHDFFQEKRISGKLIESKEINAGYNKQLVLEAAAETTDYSLFFEVGDYFEGVFTLPELTADSYSFNIENSTNPLEKTRKLLIKNDGNFRWRGVLQAFLDSTGEVVDQVISGDYTLHLHQKIEQELDSKKRLNEGFILEKAILDNIDPDLHESYMYEAAQAFQDAQRFDKAIQWYEKYVEAFGLHRDITDVYQYLGQCYHQLGQGDTAMYLWLKGYNYNPKRIGCLYELIKLAKEEDSRMLVYQFGKIALEILSHNAEEINKLSISENDIYVELSNVAYHANDLELGYECCKKILQGNVDEEMHLMALYNLNYYKEYVKNESNETIKWLIALVAVKVSENPDERLNETLNYLITIMKP